MGFILKEEFVEHRPSFNLRMIQLNLVSLPLVAFDRKSESKQGTSLSFPLYSILSVNE